MKYAPLTADRYRLGRTLRGDARLVCVEAEPAAEVVNVYIEHARIEVDLRVVGTDAGLPWAELVAAGRRVECPLAEVEPGVWRLRAPLAEMLPSTDRAEHWNVMVHTDGHPPLRLARRLHDVRTPERVFAMRKILVSPARGALMTIQPRYTRQATSGSPADASPGPSEEQMKVAFLLTEADVMGDAERALFGHAAELATRYEVQVISVFKARRRRFTSPDPRVAVSFLVESLQSRAVRLPGPDAAVGTALAALPSEVVERRWDERFHRLADIEVEYALHNLDADVLVVTSPARCSPTRHASRPRTR